MEPTVKDALRNDTFSKRTRDASSRAVDAHAADDRRCAASHASHAGADGSDATADPGKKAGVAAQFISSWTDQCYFSSHP